MDQHSSGGSDKKNHNDNDVKKDSNNSNNSNDDDDKLNNELGSMNIDSHSSSNRNCLYCLQKVQGSS